MISQMSFSYIPPAVQPRTEGGAGFSKDPVCGARVEIYSALASVVYRGVTYHFCSEACHACFTRQPGQYHRVPEAGSR